MAEERKVEFAGSGAWVMLAVSAVSFFVTLGGGFGIKYKEGENVAGITALSMVAAVIHVVINLAATFAHFRAVRHNVGLGVARVCGHSLRNVKGVRLGNCKSALCAQELVQGS